MIGNGFTDLQGIFATHYEMQCRPQSVPPVNDISTCVQIKRMLPRCEKRIKETCFDTMDKIDCQAAIDFCMNAIELPFLATGANPYDLSRECEGGLEESLCYFINNEIKGYLDQPHIRLAIGADPHIGEFTLCSSKIELAFNSALDSAFPTQYYIEALLERGVKVLLYVGATDWACNWISVNKMSLQLEWSGQEAFTSEPLREWKVGDRVAGSTRSAGLLTFATIDGAGHMVPYDRPEVALEMVNRWLASKDL